MRSRFIGLCIALTPALAVAQGAACPPGQARSMDTAGHCCWPAQAWSRSRRQCVGVPQCPEGTRVEGETCVSVCGAGQSITADTAGHCCWPGQAWSSTRQACVGIPQCPTGFEAEGQSCRKAGCPEGQAMTPDTAGHCCWPNQVWSSARSACVGIPACPPPLVAQGQTCVAASGEPAPRTPESVPPPSGGPAVPVSFDAAQTGFFGESYDVEVAGQTCGTPCTLSLSPGLLKLTVSRPFHTFDTQILVPPGGASVKLDHARMADIVSGAVLTAAGFTLTPIGIALLLSGGGTATTVVGGVSLGVGIGLLIGGGMMLTISLIHVRAKDSAEVLPPKTSDNRSGARDPVRFFATAVPVRGGGVAGAGLVF